MDILCPRCLGDAPPAESVHMKMATFANLALGKLYCDFCKECVALQIHQKWESIERCLYDSSQTSNGWQDVRGAQDILIVYIMSQIIYNEGAGHTEPLFDIPDPGDTIRIMWRNSQALGYYSVKPKGTFVHASHEEYKMHTLDTAFIHPRCRRQGLGIAIIHDMASSYPGENLGISTPISKSMQHVALKFLEENPSYKMRLWEIDGTGSPGSKKLLFYTLKKKLSI